MTEAAWWVADGHEKPVLENCRNSKPFGIDYCHFCAPAAENRSLLFLRLSVPKVKFLHL